MNYRRFRLAFPTALLTAVTLFVVSPARAHHSYAAFDDTRIRTLEGTVKTFQWINPHVVLKVLVKLDDRGESQEWSIESSSPAILTRFGWRRNSMKPGDRVSVICNPLRDGSHGGRLHSLTMLDTDQTLKTKLSASTDLGLK
jgi:Family of unknown function (DUF6152)